MIEFCFSLTSAFQIMEQTIKSHFSTKSKKITVAINMDDLGLFVRGSVFQRINICIFLQFVLKWNHKQEGIFKRMLSLIKHVFHNFFISFQIILYYLLSNLKPNKKLKWLMRLKDYFYATLIQIKASFHSGNIILNETRHCCMCYILGNGGLCGEST